MRVSAQSEYQRRSATHKSRSRRMSLGRGCWRLNTASCWRRATESNASLWRGRQNARMCAMTGTSRPVAPIIVRRVESETRRAKCFSLRTDQVLMTHTYSSSAASTDISKASRTLTVAVGHISRWQTTVRSRGQSRHQMLDVSSQSRRSAGCIIGTNGALPERNYYSDHLPLSC